MKQRARGLAFAVSLCALSLGAPSLAQAQPRPDKAASDQRARDLFGKGDTAYAEGRYDEALAAFEEAFELSQRPQLLFNISNALERLGRYEGAVDALEKYLASGKAHDRDVIQKRLANLKKRVEDQKRDDRIARDEEERKQREAEERRRAEAEAKRNAEPVRESVRTEAQPEGPSRALPIALLAAGGAALITGGVFGVLTLSARSDASNGCDDRSGENLCQSSARSAIDREKTFGLVADIGILAGLVLGGVGTYLLVTTPSAKARATSAPVRVVTRSNGGGLELVGTF